MLIKMIKILKYGSIFLGDKKIKKDKKKSEMMSVEQKN